MRLNNTAHHIKSIRYSLNKMIELGYDTSKCLEGTELPVAELDKNTSITLDQEFRFNANLLKVSKDPLLGLKLGEAYPPEVYGVVGYAMISADNLRHALSITNDYGDLTYSMFTLAFKEDKETSVFTLSPKFPIKPELHQLFADRDVSAAKIAFEKILGTGFSIKKVSLPHAGSAHKAQYEEYFNCDVELGCETCTIEFDSSILNHPLPKRDVETSAFCEQQCKHLIAKLSARSGFIDEVRWALLARPGFFPNADQLAEQISVSPRTLRRKLKQEGSSYQEILDEIRYGIAREYLSETMISIEEISELLNYSDPGNFSHAFKRWSSMSPLSWRQQNQQQRA